MTAFVPFDGLVEEYDAGRPDYPDALYDELARLGHPLAGADVAEIGAGTGIATRAMTARGARVTAVDLSPNMLARLRDRTPGVRGVSVGVGEALPLPDGSADLVCYAQAWHWVDVPLATAEAVRVLRPGGALAVWWNDVDADDLPWYEAQRARIEAANPGWTRSYRTRDWAAELTATGRLDVVGTATLRFTRTLPLADYETWLRSKSYVAAIGSGLPAFLAAERASLLAAFPDGNVVEPFSTRLVMARPLARPR